MEEKQKYFLEQEYLRLWKAYGADRFLTHQNWTHVWDLPTPTQRQATVAFVQDGFPSPDEKQLLEKISQAMGLELPDVAFLCFGPESDREKLRSDLRVLCPEVVVALGEKPAQALLEFSGAWTQVRGQFYFFSESPRIEIVATLSPGHLLKNPVDKKIVWDDMKQVMAKLEKKP